MTRETRLLILAAGLIGAAGVALAAAASHGGEERLMGSASAMCLAHAPVLLALAAMERANRFRAGAGFLLAGGVVLFAGDLVMRTRTGSGLFAMAAPAGGMAMIAGWIAIMSLALLPAAQKRN